MQKNCSLKLLATCVVTTGSKFLVLLDYMEMMHTRTSFFFFKFVGTENAVSMLPDSQKMTEVVNRVVFVGCKRLVLPVSD